MEVPLEDFSHLPEDLGCSLHRTAERLTLASEQPGCAMHFRLEGQQARLEGVEVSNDPQGHFLRDVVGLVLQIYSGDLDAELTWSPTGTMEDRVRVRGGELLSVAEEPPPQQLERWLTEARGAWKEYLLLKSTPEV